MALGRGGFRVIEGFLDHSVCIKAVAAAQHCWSGGVRMQRMQVRGCEWEQQHRFVKIALQEQQDCAYERVFAEIKKMACSSTNTGTIESMTMWRLGLTEMLPQSWQPQASYLLVLNAPTRIMHRAKSSRTMIRHGNFLLKKAQQR